MCTGLFSPGPGYLTHSWGRAACGGGLSVCGGRSGPAGARTVGGELGASPGAVVLGRRDVSAVLCGPGERGWGPRGVDGSRRGREPRHRAGLPGVHPSSGVEQGADGGSPGQTPRRLRDRLGPERGAGQAGKPSVSRAGGQGRGEARGSTPRSPRPAFRTWLGRGGRAWWKIPIAPGGCHLLPGHK